MDGGRVLGLGGVFLDADDPEGLAGWYREALGLTFRRDSDGCLCADFPERDHADPATVHEVALTLRPRRPGTPRAAPLVTYRVRGLAALLLRLQARGAAVDGPRTLPFGAFAWTADAEGNPVELYEPQAP